MALWAAGLRCFLCNYLTGHRCIRLKCCVNWKTRKTKLQEAHLSHDPPPKMMPFDQNSKSFHISFLAGEDKFKIFIRVYRLFTIYYIRHTQQRFVPLNSSPVLMRIYHNIALYSYCF